MPENRDWEEKLGAPRCVTQVREKADSLLPSARRFTCPAASKEAAGSGAAKVWSYLAEVAVERYTMPEDNGAPVIGAEYVNPETLSFPSQAGAIPSHPTSTPNKFASMRIWMITLFPTMVPPKSQNLVIW